MDSLSYYALEITREMLKGESVNPTILDFLKNYASTLKVQQENQEENDLLKSDDEFDMEYGTKSITEMQNSINVERTNTIKKLYQEPEQSDNNKSRTHFVTFKKPLTVHELQKSKKNHLDKLQKRRKEMFKPVKPETLLQNQKEQQGMLKRIGAKPYKETLSNQDQEARNERQRRQDTRRRYGETLSATQRQRITQKPQLVQIIQEKPAPLFDPSLRDYLAKIDKEVQRYHSFTDEIYQEVNLPNFDTGYIHTLLDTPFNPNQSGSDYHMRFAILFQQLETQEERIQQLKAELE